ncbi:MAG: hypothetical protein RIT35_1211 [Pseudomonadota bacterium]
MVKDINVITMFLIKINENVNFTDLLFFFAVKYLPKK